MASLVATYLDAELFYDLSQLQELGLQHFFSGLPWKERKP
jgi:hypothetical protein